MRVQAVFCLPSRFIICMLCTMALSLLPLQQLPVSCSSLFKALPSSSSLSVPLLSFLTFFSVSWDNRTHLILHTLLPWWYCKEKFCYAMKHSMMIKNKDTRKQKKNPKKPRNNPIWVYLSNRRHKESSYGWQIGVIPSMQHRFVLWCLDLATRDCPITLASA